MFSCRLSFLQIRRGSKFINPPETSTTHGLFSRTPTLTDTDRQTDRQTDTRRQHIAHEQSSRYISDDSNDNDSDNDYTIDPCIAAVSWL